VGLSILGCSRAQPNDPWPVVTGPSENTYTTEETDYHAPPPERDDSLADDQLDVKRLPPFDPKLVDSRPLGDWGVNTSVLPSTCGSSMLLSFERRLTG
jgi:hypothetical protein